MYARTFIISYLKYRYLLPFLVLLCFPSFSTLFIFCEFAPNRPVARKFANYEAFKIPLSVLMQTFVLIFGFVFFCFLLFCLPLSVARTDLRVFPSLVSLFSVEHIS